MKYLLFVILCLTLGAQATLHHFNGYQVIRASPSNEVQLQAIRTLEQEGKYDFWAEPRPNAPADIMVSPETLPILKQFLENNNVPYSIMIQNVEKIVSEQRETKANRQPRNDFMNWLDYQRLDLIYGWLRNMTRVYPNLITMTTIGQSTEGRDIHVFKISTGGSGKPTFWIDATIHAREWISTGVVTYVLNELVTKSNKYWDILSAVDFYILPVVNPDGYEFTHTTNRMWRKTRSNHDSALGCMGVDANRNFGFQFGGPGSSNDKCSETYRGPVAYSEPEAAAVKDYILSLTGTVNWQAFITVHSYSQLWMTPWGYSHDLPDDYEELKELSDRAVAELTALYNTTYTTGSSANVLYQSSGSSRDWAKGEGGFKYVYTVELRDTGTHGFLLPPEQILPTAEETWAGIQVVARQLIANK